MNSNQQRLHALPIVCLALLLAGCKPSEEPRAQAIVGAVLMDGTGGPPISDSVVTIEGSRIRAVGNRASLPVPADSDKIDGSGKFLVPGLIDLEAPLNAPGGRQGIEQSLARYLAKGVTSVLSGGAGDLEGRARAIQRRRVAIDENHRMPVGRRHLRDPTPHGAGAKNPHRHRSCHPGLSSQEVGRSLLLKRPHAFFIVGGPSRLALERRLDVELLREIVRQRRIQRALDQPKAARRLRGQVPRQPVRGLHERSRGDHLVNHPPILGLLGRHLAPQHHEGGRACESHEARQKKRPARVGDQPDLDERLNERRRVRREDDVTGQRETRAGARRRAVHGRHDRLLQPPHR